MVCTVAFHKGEWEPLNENILLIAKVDEAYRQLLLESQGYTVRRLDEKQARIVLRSERFRLAMITTERGTAATLALCEELKSFDSEMRVAVLAQRAEYLPPHDCVDALIREQYSPGKFLATVQKLVEGRPLTLKDDSSDQNDSAG